MIDATSPGVASKECGSALAPVSIDVTVACSPATALATLPQTSVVATTLTAPWSCPDSPWLVQPATASAAASPTASLIAVLPTDSS